jgi:hypothetical protein
LTEGAPRIAAIFARRHPHRTEGLRRPAVDRRSADVTSESAVEVSGGHIDATIWQPGKPVRVVRKH